MDYIEELKTLALLIELAEIRLNRAMYARWECDDNKVERSKHRIDVAMEWADRRKGQMVSLLTKNTYLSKW